MIFKEISMDSPISWFILCVIACVVLINFIRSIVNELDRNHDESESVWLEIDDKTKFEPIWNVKEEDDEHIS